MTVNLIDTLYFKENNNFATGGRGMEILVQTNNLTKWYEKHKVINNVNLSVKKGEIYGLIGRNGAGKTTGMYSAKPVYTRAIIEVLIFLLAEIILLCMVMGKKEIK